MSPARTSTEIRCSISREIKDPLVISREVLLKVEHILLAIRDENVSAANGKYELDRIMAGPDFSLKMTDGSEFSPKNTDQIFDVSAMASRHVKSLRLTVSGSTTVSISLGDLWSPSARISAQGFEDKAYHYAMRIEEILRHGRDQTRFVRAIPGFLWMLLIVLFFLYVMLIPIPRDWIFDKSNAVSDSAKFWGGLALIVSGYFSA